MFERKLTSLQSRKSLLIAESELNRTLLAQDYQALAGHVREAMEPARTATAWLARGYSVMNLIRNLGNGHSENGSSGKISLSMRLLRLGVGLWVGLRGRRS